MMQLAAAGMSKAGIGVAGDVVDGQISGTDDISVVIVCGGIHCGESKTSIELRLVRLMLLLVRWCWRL